MLPLQLLFYHEAASMLEWVLKLLFMFVASQEHLDCVYFVVEGILFS